MNECDIVKKTTSSPQVPMAYVEILEPKHVQGNGEKQLILLEGILYKSVVVA